MSKPETIWHCDPFDALFEHAELVVTEDSNEYFRIPVWFQKMGDGKFVIHTDKLPEDLSMFICKSGLGGDNPKPIKPES